MAGGYLLKYGRAGLRDFLGLPALPDPPRPKRRYITRARRVGYMKLARGLEKAGLHAQAAGLRDKMIDLERESLRKRLYRKQRNNAIRRD